MIGYMTKNDTVGQGQGNVLGHCDPQPRLNFHPQLIDVSVSRGRFLHVHATDSVVVVVATVTTVVGIERVHLQLA